MTQTQTQLLERVRQLRAEGRSPKEIARALGVAPAAVSPLVRTVAEERVAAAPEPALVGCWVSPGWSNGLTVQASADWPVNVAGHPDGSGLAGVLVGRRHRYGRASICGYLVDTWCLGVKNALGPRVMNDSEMPGFTRTFFDAFDAAPLEAPIELAQHLVWGAVEYARHLGFEPHRDFWAAAGHLGSLRDPCAIEFGKDGEPFYIEGPNDDSPRNMRTLERSVGEHNFGFIMSAV
jgi:hypothetical protein